MQKVKPVLFSSLLFLMSSFLHAQTVTWSAPVSDNSKVPYMKILGSESSGFYVLRSNLSLDHSKNRSGLKARRYLLQKFSSEMNLMAEYDLKAPVENGRLADLQMVNGKVLLVFYSSDKLEKKFRFYAQYLNDEAGLSGSPVLLAEFESEDIDEYKLPGIITSKDESKIAFTYRNLPGDRLNQLFRTVVLDSDLKLLYTKSFSVDIPAKLFVPVSSVLTNEGNFFILGLRFITEKKVRSPEESYYLLIGFNRISGKEVEKEVKIEDRFLTDISITTDAYNRRVVVIGFYSDKTTYSTAGVFYYAMDEDSLMDSKVFSSPFPQEFLVKFSSEKRENKSRELVNYSIDRMMLRRDGGAALAAESFYQTSRTYWDYYTQSTVSHYYYHYGNIMVISINPDGQILWGNAISKDQNSIDDSGYMSSYASIVSGGKLYFIYNKYVNESSSVLLTEVDGQGTQKTSVLFNETERVAILPRSGKQIDEDVFILPAYRENKFHFVELSFD